MRRDRANGWIFDIRNKSSVITYTRYNQTCTWGTITFTNTLNVLANKLDVLFHLVFFFINLS